jgi:hypothetical protein
VGLPLSYPTVSTVDDRRGRRLLFLGEDWSEKSHDVELQDAGRVLARAKLPEAIAGMARAELPGSYARGHIAWHSASSAGCAGRPEAVPVGTH